MTQTATRSRSRTMKSYTPYTLSDPIPYGLWLNIPFRKRGSGELRAEAKQRGARYNPHGITDDFRWWIPGRMLTIDTLLWLNTNQLITGERSAPVFIPNAMGFTFDRIDFTRPVTLSLEVPYDNRDDAKRMGAQWDTMLRKWRVLNDRLTEDVLNECIRRKWASTLFCHLKGDDRMVSTSFFSHDNGRCHTRPNGRQWHFTSADGNAIISMTEDDVVLKDAQGSATARMLFIQLVMGTTDAVAWRDENGNSKTVFNLMGYNTADHAREIWGKLIGGGWTVQERKR